MGEVQRGGGGKDKSGQLQNWKQCEAGGWRRAWGGILPPHVHMCEFSCSTQPTHAHWLASVERDGHEEIKPRQLPEEAMDVGKVTLI